MCKSILSLAFFLFIIGFSRAQETFPVNGVRDDRIKVYAFTNATIFRDYRTKLEKATLIIREGKVVAVGTGSSIPKGAIVQDLSGKTIYPALVDIYSGYGLPEVEKRSFNFFATPQMETNKKGPFAWNQTIRPETNAVTEFKVNDKDAESLRVQGFGAVLSHVKDGIARGSSVLVLLASDAEQNVVIIDKASAHYSFDRGSSSQLYPTSIMGSIALLRQTYYDVQWYKNSTDRSLNPYYS